MSKCKRGPLTESQVMVYLAILRHYAEHGEAPSIREICNTAFTRPVNTNGVSCHLDTLQIKGYITRESDKSRQIKIAHIDQAIKHAARELLVIDFPTPGSRKVKEPHMKKGCRVATLTLGGDVKK